MKPGGPHSPILWGFDSGEAKTPQFWVILGDFVGFVSILRVFELECNFWGESVRFWGGEIKKSVSHLLASPRVRPRRTAPWKAIATPPPPPKTAPKNGRFRQNQNPTVSLHHRRRGGKGPKVPKYRRNCPKNLPGGVAGGAPWWCTLWGAFGGVFGWKIADFGTYGRTGRGARPAPAPRALGRFRGFLGFWGFSGGAASPAQNGLGKRDFGVTLVSAAQNGLGKWDFGSSVLPRR